jgi:putative transcriptional regulator
MLAHARGELQLTEIEYPVLSDIDVKRLRESLGLSQADFARLYGINMRALQDWEQGRRRPESAVRAYLTVIRKDPDFVARALKLTA